MSFWEHRSEFAGKPVVDYTPGGTLEPEKFHYRLRTEWESDHDFDELLAAFLASPNVDQVTGLLTGSYGDEMYDDPMTEVTEGVVSAADRLPRLEALFIGDIISEENEVSWIQNGDMSTVWQAFPRLRVFGTRGQQNLSLGTIAHDQLQALIIEGGGMGQDILHQVAASSLPELQHLELFLGDSGYGWGGAIDDVQTLLTGELFPKLKYLGLRNSEISDEVAIAVCQSPLLARIEVLDLSMGTISDVGGQALLDCAAVRNLRRLDVSHNYFSDDMRKALEQLPIEVNADRDDAYGDGGEERYVAVGE